MPALQAANPVARLPHEIMDMVFSYLPTADLKTVALVCKSWKSMTQHSKFWSKALVKIYKDDIEEKLQSERVGVIGRVHLVDDLTAEELHRVLTGLEASQQRNSNPLRVENGRLRVKARSQAEVEAILQTIIKAGRQLELKHLNLCHEDLSSVQPELLAEAVVRVEGVNLACTGLREEQVVTVLSRIVETQHLNLKRLSLLGEGDRVCRVPPELLALAVIRLEEPDNVLAGVTEEQVLAVCTKILEVDRQRLKTKTLKLSCFVSTNMLPYHIESAVKLKLKPERSNI